MAEKTIDFPARDDASNAKLMNLLKNLADCLESPISIETVSIVRVKYDGSRLELDSILKRLGGNMTGLKPINKPKVASKKLYRPGEQKLEKYIDPLGS